MKKIMHRFKTQTLKRSIWLLLALLLGATALVAGVMKFWGAQSTGNSGENSLSDKPGIHMKEAPDFKLPDVKGKLHSLEEFRGKLTLVHFWASWCPPCLDEIPHWVELSRTFKGRPLQLVAVSLDQKWDEAQKILPSEKLPPQVLSLLDAGGTIPDFFGTYQYPETYLVSPDLKIMTKWVGPQDWDGENMKKLLERLLGAIRTGQ